MPTGVSRGASPTEEAWEQLYYEAFWLMQDYLAYGRRTSVWEHTSRGFVIHRLYGPVRERHQ